MSSETTTLEPVPLRRRLHRGLLPAAVVYAWVGGSFDSFTTASVLAVGFPGVLGVLTASSRWPDERAVGPRRPPRAALVWAAWFVATALWEAYAFLKGSTPAHPTLSVLLDGPLANHAVRTVFFFGWLNLGWRLLQR